MIRQEKITYKRKADYNKILKFKMRPYEGKMMDASAILQIIDANATNTGVFLLNGIQEGTGMWNRVGRHVNLKSLQLKFRIFKNAIATNVNDTLKIAIVYDRQPSNSAALPNYNAIFQNRNFVGGTTSNVYSWINADNIERFVILKEMTWVPPEVSTSTTTYSSVIALNMGSDGNIPECYLDLEGLTTHYNGTANPITLANITTGGLYVVVQGTQTAVNASWSVFWFSRLRYNDC